MADRQTLTDWLTAQTEGRDGGASLAAALTVIADGCARISALLRGAPLATNGNGVNAIHTVVEDGAAAILEEAARDAPIAYLASEDHPDVVVLDESAPLALAVDALDGASNIDANVSTGTIFSVFPRAGLPLASFLRPAREQLAAGYVMYGPYTVLVLTLGRGTAMFALDTDGVTFRLVDPELRTPEDAATYAINAANYRHWEPPVRAYIDDCVEGRAGPRDKDFKMRWVATLTAETHRILTQGGVFLYPRDARPGHERGTLHRVFDAVPIAFIAEQCGGGATDGANRILDSVPESLHARAPLVFGSRKKVARVQRYHEDPDFVCDQAPLFGVRGLFRG
ncbi:class 1 fructose-bisphosphatase [Roseospira goensis]|uniref:Fructose-1,6-bisphosphatase class 1 n=1 Tax=Roseospira goensis TaxID=391922 RepID=A0A7W6RZV8_9PROT|nr:class 1 fructose-bisphosphatase [Roseospira goensis]MBB4285642.1 fructose-1,6-bisphosphatase I [Roseospira goensis]